MAGSDDGDIDYASYVPNTTDPGLKMLGGAFLFCLVSLFLLPLFISSGRKRESRRLALEEADRGDETEPGLPGPTSENFSDCEPGISGAASGNSPVSVCVSAADPSIEIDPGAAPSIIQNASNSVQSKLFTKKSHLEKELEMVSPTTAGSNVTSRNPDASNRGKRMVLVDADALKPVRLFLGEGAVFSRRNLSEGVNYIFFLSENDAETKKLLELAVPMTSSMIFCAIFEIVDAVIISRFLGLDAFAAFVLVEALIEISDCLFMGVVDTINTVCAHAVGTENYFLAGQYVQIACFLYVLMSIPATITWYLCTEPFVLWLTDEPHIAAMALDLVYWYTWKVLLEGLEEALGSLLDVIGHETYNAAKDILHVATTSLIKFLVFRYIRKDLATFGIIAVATGTIEVILSFLISYKMGWLDPFWEGLFRNVAMKNMSAVKHIIVTGIPLGIGEFLAYVEWEVCLIFANMLGPVELVVWGMMGTVWEVLEATTEGISEAAGVRIALHLGKGRSALAKISAHKLLYFSLVLGILMTSLLYMLSKFLPTWFTDVKIVQTMMYDIIHLVGLGNMFMVCGMTAWGVLGGQGRFYLATVTLIVCSWGMTLPLSAVSTFYRFNLKGQVTAIVIGYVTAAMALLYFVHTSNWEALSAKIIEKNKLEEEARSVIAERNDRGPEFDEDDDWDELPTVIQEAAMVLGFTKRMWDRDKSPASEDKDWEELTPEEQCAARFLGYAAKWDED